MCQAVLSPNLTKKFQWEVSQIADNRFPCMMLLGGLSVNLNHLKSMYSKLCQKSISSVHISVTNYMSMKWNRVTNMKDLHRGKKKAYDDIPYTEP